MKEIIRKYNPQYTKWHDGHGKNIYGQRLDEGGVGPR